jgi:hypothetical protein
VLTLISEVLVIRSEAQAADRVELGSAWQDNGLVFTTKTLRPVEPRNLVRSFHRICSDHGLWVIKVHHLILGHSRLAVTLEIYTREDRQAQHDALAKLGDALRNDGQATR